jgi:hypothetical protein
MNRDTGSARGAGPRSVVRSRWYAPLLLGAVGLTAGGLAGCGAAGSTHTDPVPPRPRHAAPTGASATPSARPHVVVYRITGRGTATSVSYVSDAAGHRTTEHGVRLPWTRTVTVPAGGGDHPVGLAVDFAEVGGATHDDSVTVDGTLVSHGTVSGTGADQSDLSGSFSG